MRVSRAEYVSLILLLALLIKTVALVSTLILVALHWL